MTRQVALHAYLSDSYNSLPNREFVHDVAKAALKAGGI
ncbi:peptide ABC transporter substrate-binding protein, partial [Pseudomonas syringae pv. actinidiae]|nr:peptide ABC transporter substrate-binding protein [Pseudomonas syringae pv. actinidiae]